MLKLEAAAKAEKKASLQTKPSKQAASVVNQDRQPRTRRRSRRKQTRPLSNRRTRMKERKAMAKEAKNFTQQVQRDKRGNYITFF